MIRRGSAEDLEWCLAHDKEVPEDVLEWKLCRGDVLIADERGHRVGFLRLEYLWSKFPFIGLVWVEDGYRRNKNGTGLVLFLEEILRTKGYDTLWSSTMPDNPAGLAWHRKLGFEETGFLARVNTGDVGELFFRKPIPRASK